MSLSHSFYQQSYIEEHFLKTFYQKSVSWDWKNQHKVVVISIHRSKKTYQNKHLKAVSISIEEEHPNNQNGCQYIFLNYMWMSMRFAPIACLMLLTIVRFASKTFSAETQKHQISRWNLATNERSSRISIEIVNLSLELISRRFLLDEALNWVGSMEKFVIRKLETIDIASLMKSVRC